MAQDDWSGFKVVKKAGVPVAPAPATTTLPTSPSRQAEAQRAAQAAVYAGNRDARDDAQLKNEQERLRLANEAAAREAAAAAVREKTVQANAGVETREGQDNAAFHAVNMSQALKSMKLAAQNNPDSLKPGTLETIAGWFTEDPTIQGYAQKWGGGADRQISAKAAKGALESSIYMFTGAAAQSDQVKRMGDLIVPNQSDDEKTLQWKRQNMATQIQAMRAKAGPADLKVLQALDELEGSLDFLYSPEKAKIPPKDNNPFFDAEGRPMRSISDIAPDTPTKASEDFELMPYPEQASIDHATWVKSNPQATTEQYLEFVQGLDHKYRDQMEGYKPAYGSPGELAPWSQQQINDAEAFLKYHREHPNAQIPQLQWHRKLGTIEKGVNWIGQSDPGVALTNYANAMTIGIPEALASDRQRQNFQRRNSESPLWAFAGDIAGSISPVNRLAKPLGGLLAKKVVKEDAEKLAMILANGGYGAARGAASAPEGETLETAAKAGAVSLLGGLGGTAAGRGSRGFNSAQTRADLDMLSGVKKMTLPQAMGLGHVEESFRGLPGVRGARQKALESFNLDNVNRALANIEEKLPKKTKPGFEANAKVDEIVSKTYNNLRPSIVGNFDGQYAQATQALKAGVRNSRDPLKLDLFKQIEATQGKFRNGSYDGMSYKDANEKLRQLANDWRQVEAGPGVTSPSTYHEMAKVADKFREQLRAQVSRNTPEVGEKLKALDKTWAHKLRIENATNRNPATGIYTPKQLLTTLKMLDSSKGRGQFARGKAFDQKYAQAADNILGSASAPESGNFMQAMAALYLALRHPIAVGLPASAAAVPSYTPGLNKLAKLLITGKRPDGVANTTTTATAQAIRKYMAEGE